MLQCLGKGACGDAVLALNLVYETVARLFARPTSARLFCWADFFLPGLGTEYTT